MALLKHKVINFAGEIIQEIKNPRPCSLSFLTATSNNCFPPLWLRFLKVAVKCYLQLHKFSLFID